MAYVLCVIIVFAASVAFGAIAASPVVPGDEDAAGRVATVYRPGMSLPKRDKLIEDIFLVTVLPALIGVRLALGRKIATH